jgi:hypothetical protein
MMRYMSAAAALKMVSIAPARPLYRRLGNRVGARRRASSAIDAQPSNYLGRAKRVLDLAKEHRLVTDGARLLEIGTGWVHWEATILRLFYDLEATLVDVWDNRQLAAYKAHLSEIDRYINTGLGMDRTRSRHAHALVAKMLAARSFNELYETAGFTYLVDPTGTLDCLPDASFDFIVSSTVLEHVRRETLPTFLKNTERILRDGGRSYHAIDLGDHLSYYDPKAHPKQYLAYGERTWKLLFENRVQYFNRLQLPEWLSLFAQTDLTLVTCTQASRPLQGLRVARQFRRFSHDDLGVETVALIHEKRAHPAAQATAC